MDRTIVSGLVVAALLAPVSADARITQIEFTRVESPTFGGASFGDSGPFEKLVGRAWGEVDPTDPLNAIIQDIELAPRNARGMVEYSTDVFIIKPVNMSLGNRMLFYNVVNRGNKGGFTTFNTGAEQPENEPTAPGDGFLQHMGYTLVWSGWQPDVLAGNGRMTMQVPIARNPDGSSITGNVRSELITSLDTFTLNLSSGRFTGLTHSSYPTVHGQPDATDGRLPAYAHGAHPRAGPAGTDCE